MSRLVKPADYAKETGISRQAIYAKVKRGSLASKEVNDQLFIVIDDDNKQKIKNTVSTQQSSTSKSSSSGQSRTISNEFQTIINAKNETIETLKNRIHDLKESNKELSYVFRSEIELLKEAFGEMKKIYSYQLEHQKKSAMVMSRDLAEPKWISVKKFLKKYDVDKKHSGKVKKYLNMLYTGGDTRVTIVDDKIKINSHNSSKEMIKEALED
ncbi:MAG: DUF3972 domain-containing protein [Sulfurovaceae bacterium]|nr:DUF3972 domain-containing protein [Sulfurovaceae bacterium]